MKRGIVLCALCCSLLILLWGCTPQPVACPEDAKVCEDGSVVVRSGPDCAFEQCPEVKERCDNKDTSKQFIRTSIEFCNRVEFVCDPGSKPFFDECGCGCEIVDEQEGNVRDQCDQEGGKWGVWSNAVNAAESCNPATSDQGMDCTDSSQCESYCQAKENAQVGDDNSGSCYGWKHALCMKEVLEGTVATEWCA